MSAVNKNLFLSLKQDLQNLSTTQKKILSNFQSFNLNSWLYPAKQFWEVNNTQVEAAHESFRYTMFLELIIDKLYLLVHLMINYINNFSNALTQEQMRKNIKPVKLTLGRSIELLWNKLENLIRLNLSKTELKPMSLESYTQTTNEENSQSELYIPVLKELCTSLESNSAFSNLKNVKEKLQKDVFDLTNHSCVNKLTSGLLYDTKQLIKQRDCLEDKNIKIRFRLKEYCLKYKKSLKTIDDVNHSLKKFKKMYNNEFKNHKITIIKMKILKEKITVQDNNIKKYENKVKFLEQSVQSSQTNLDLLKCDNELLHNSISQLKVENAQLQEEIKLWKDRFSDVYLENTKLNLNTQLVEKTHIFKTTMESINDSFEEFMKKLKALNARIEEKSNNLKNFIQTTVDVADTEMIKEAGRLRQHESSFIVLGDPISDMRHQIEINKSTIKELEKSNFQLSETIAKIQTTAQQI